MSTKAVAKYGLASLLPRGIAIANAVIMLPLMIKHLGVEGYAVWLLATQIPTLVASPDLGLGQAIINPIARAHRTHGNLDSQRDLIAGVSDAMRIITIGWLAAGATAAYIYTNPQDSHGALKTFAALLAGLLCFLSAVPASLWSRVQLAQERGHVALLWEASARLVALLATASVVITIADPLCAIVTTLLPPSLTAWINALKERRQTFGNARIRHREGRIAGLKRTLPVMRVGQLFVAMQLAYLLSTALDPYILAHFHDEKTVTQWSVSRRPFDILPLIVGLYSTALWPWFSRAAEKRDSRRLFRALYTIAGTSAAICVASGIAIMAFSDTIYAYLSNDSLTVSSSTITFLLIYATSLTLSMILTNFLNALGSLRTQALICAASAIATFGFKTFVASRFGLDEFFATSSIMYLLTWVIPIAALAGYELHKLAGRESNATTD